MIFLSNMSDIFLGTLGGVLVTLVTGWLGIQLAVRLKLMDIPGVLPRKQHHLPTPYAGGIAMFLSLLVLLFGSGMWKSIELRGLLLAVLVIFVFGIWDDYKKLPPVAKLCGQLLAAIILIRFGVYIRIFESSQFFIGGHHAFVWLDWAVTLFWIVGVTNAFNLVDSMDGLAVGLSAWAFAFFMLAMLDSQQRVLSVFSAMVLGICLGLLFYNVTPARLFLGDAGAQGLGLLLATIAILYTPQVPYQKSSWFVPILLVGVPIFDTALVSFSRLRHRKPFYLGGMDHTYHRLVVLGLEPGRAVLAMHMVALMLECAAFVALSLPPGQANGIFIACLVAGLICMFYLDNPKRWS
jgi:UDP-GlcNAc:undecaprenyl-phosphate/decaprenyl-phosphate GlcNAc-1-phosphate transferase